MKMTKRILSWLLTMVLLAGLLPLQAFAEPQQNPEQTPAAEKTTGELPDPAEEPAIEDPERTEKALAKENSEEPFVEGKMEDTAADTLEMFALPRYEHAEQMDIETKDPQKVPFTAEMRRSPTTYTDVNDAVEYLQGRMINRRDDVTVDMKIPYNSRLTDADLEELWYAIVYAAMAHDPEKPEGGDYLAGHVMSFAGSFAAQISGSNILLEYKYSFEYLSTWNQESRVNDQIYLLFNKLGIKRMDDYEKIQAIYHYMTENIQYDYDGLEDASDLMKYTAYGALVEKSAVTRGYVLLFNRLAMEAGLDARVIMGQITDGNNAADHMWNIVKQGIVYYNVDSMLDAQLVQAGYEPEFFLRCQENFPGHTRDAAYNNYDFNQAYPMGKIDCIPNALAAGACGENAIWILKEDYTLVLSGTGATTDYSYYGAPWYEYKDVIKALVVEEGITHLGNYSFYECGRATKLSLPQSLVSIGKEAVSRCASLTSLTIPASVTTVGDKAFSALTSLTEVVIPGTVEKLGNGTFEDCYSLIKITMQKGKNTIAPMVAGCKKLETVILPDNIEIIPDRAFMYCYALEEITLPGNLKSIGEQAFEACEKLKNIQFPDGLEIICDHAFERCGNLVEVEIPDSVTSIGKATFKNCIKLENAWLPDGITIIPEAMFEKCKALKNVSIPDGITEIGKHAFYQCAALTDPVIPESVTKLGESAFSECTGLTQMILPETITELGAYVFSGCTGLTKAQLHEGVSKIGKMAFSNCTGLTEFTIPQSLNYVPAGILAGCTNLKKVNIHTGVVKVEENAFQNCENIPNMTLHAGITSIGAKAFGGCSGFTEVVIPDTVTMIGDYAFSGCDNVTILQISPNAELGNGAFSNMDSLTEAIVPEGVTKLGDGVFFGCNNIKNAVLPNSVKEYGSSVFAECTSLENIKLPDGIKKLNYNTFKACTSLKSYVIPETVTEIGWGVFTESGLEEITIPASVKTIDNQAFGNCKKLQKVVFLGEAPGMEKGTFANTKTTVYYPMNVDSWVFAKNKNFGGELTWEAYGEGCEHEIERHNQVPATCTSNGYSGDKYCTKCQTIVEAGQVIPATGHWTEYVETEPTCRHKGMKYTFCWNCGEVMGEITYVDEIPHNYVNGTCTFCGHIIKEDEEKFALHGASMTLGNELNMNFFIRQPEIGNDTGLCAVITKHYADGRADTVVTVPQAQWEKMGTLYYYFTFSGIKAKEMTDSIQVVVCNAEGEQISEVYSDSVQNYARRMLDKPETTEVQKALYIEMLNYGAAAQEFFGYNLDNLANSVITGEEQKAYGMPDRTYTDLRQTAEGYVGTTLTLENQILFNTVFSGSAVPEGGYAVATFVNHYGNSVEEKVTDFGSLGSYKYAAFRSLVVSDCRQPITVTLYDKDGNVILTVTDSVESYVARMTENSPLYQAVMKFSDAAYRYFHP